MSDMRGRHGNHARGNRSPLFKHGLTDTRLHLIWKKMKSRCTNVNDRNYVDYGARGISITSDWLDFSAFHQWAISSGYRDDLTLDRIDPNGNYTPTNCRFVSRWVQSINQRTRKDSATGIRGVDVTRENRFKVRISDHGRRICIGTFEDFFEACCARKSAENIYHREDTQC